MIEEIWRDIVDRIGTAFGRLVYAASLRDENKGTYHHYALERCASPEEVHPFLTYAHRHLFYLWLGMSLDDQLDDLGYYLRDLPATPKVILEAWRMKEPFGGYMPAGAGSGDRELFLTDLRTIVGLLTEDEESSLPESTI